MAKYASSSSPRNLRKRADSLVRAGRLADAYTLYAKACKDHPADSALWLGFSRLNRRLERYRESESCARHILAQQPDNRDALVEYGTSLQHLGRLDEAMGVWQQALALYPDDTGVHYLLATACLTKGLTDRAIAHYRRTIELSPSHIGALNNLSAILTNQGQIGEAMTLLEQALKVRPDAYQMLINLARAHLFTGNAETALDILEKVTYLYPEAVEAHSKYLLCANYVAQPDPSNLFAAHRRWGERYEKHVGMPPAHDRPVKTGGRLRIGYVSPDFKNHSVASFIEPILQQHDREQFEITCYSDVANPDSTTRRLASHVEHWEQVAGLPHERLHDKIRSDHIDILVDLAGHTANNRLPVFARKPAPVAASYLGYPNTTGLRTIDYRFTDAVADPEDIADSYHTEQLIRLPHGFLCFRPPCDSPDPVVREWTPSTPVVFGSFNNLAKITPEVVSTWSRLLGETGSSRLLLKNSAASDPYTRKRLTALFLEHGIAPERLEFLGHMPSSTEHLDAYNSIDIALDTFPYNGTTTTCEALWMGVPVVTLRGNVHAARVSASLLSRLGLETLIAGDLDNYIRIAAGVAADSACLATMRAELREKLLRSSICDARLLTRDIETAYHEMWRRYLDNT